MICVSFRFVFDTQTETLDTVILRGSEDIVLKANESYNGLSETPYSKVKPGTYE